LLLPCDEEENNSHYVSYFIRQITDTVAIITAESETTVLIGTFDQSYRIRGMFNPCLK